MARLIAAVMAVAFHLALAGAAAAQSWHLVRQTDPVTDEPTYILSLTLSSDEFLGAYCAKQIWGLMVNPKGPHPAREGTKHAVILRFDQDPPIESKWEAGTGGTFLLIGDHARPLLTRAASASRIVVRVNGETSIYKAAARYKIADFQESCPQLAR